MTLTDTAITAERATEGLSTGANGRVVPPARMRLLTRRGPADALNGWLVTAGVTLLAAFLRFWHLGTPREFSFDETYYAKDAWSLWHHGYAQNWVDKANDAILGGHYSPKLMTGDPEMVVHPELGKWLIGLGEHLFGFDPFGWRFSSAVVGTLMVLVMIRLVRRLTGSTLLGGVGGLLLCFDGLQLVLSRMALLDIYVAFFLLCATACLVADRDWTRARMATAGLRTETERLWGPLEGLWWRPWRLAAGLMFGLAISSKWSAVVPLAGFAILVVVWDAGARRSLGVRNAFLRSMVVDALPAFGYLVVVAVLVYVASWTGWIMNAHAYELALAHNNYGPYWGDYTKHQAHGFFPSLFQGLRSLWHYHGAVWGFQTHGLVNATHTYQSAPQGWIFMQRPVVVSTTLNIRPGVQGCTAPADSTCIREVVLLGTPVLWWGGVVALLHAVYAWVARRDWRYGIAVVGLVTTWVPFFRYADRPIFSFYAITILPFTIVAICLLMGRLIGPAVGPDAPIEDVRRRSFGTVVSGAFVVLVVLQFAWMWPVYTDGLLTTPEWLKRIWFRSWI